MTKSLPQRVFSILFLFLVFARCEEEQEAPNADAQLVQLNEVELAIIDCELELRVQVDNQDDYLNHNQLEWDFGDGAQLITESNSATHTYEDPGTYTVGITFDNGVGNRHSISGMVTVESYPSEILVDSIAYGFATTFINGEEVTPGNIGVILYSLNDEQAFIDSPLHGYFGNSNGPPYYYEVIDPPVRYSYATGTTFKMEVYVGGIRLPEDLLVESYDVSLMYDHCDQRPVFSADLLLGTIEVYGRNQFD